MEGSEIETSHSVRRIPKMQVQFPRWRPLLLSLPRCIPPRQVQRTVLRSSYRRLEKVAQQSKHVRTFRPSHSAAARVWDPASIPEGTAPPLHSSAENSKGLLHR